MSESKKFFETIATEFIENCINQENDPTVVEKMNMYTLVYNEMTQEKEPEKMVEFFVKTFKAARDNFTTRTSLRGSDLDAYLSKKSAIIVNSFAYLFRVRHIWAPQIESWMQPGDVK